MSRYNQVGKVATNVNNQDSLIVVRYHSTNVFTYDKVNKKVTLDTGGWFTSTTKVRMNQASTQYLDGAFSVYQEKHAWFARLRSTGETIPFEGNKLTITL